MEKKAKKSLLAGIPAWALSLIILFVSLGLFVLQLPESIVESIEEFIDINILLFIIFIILIPVACFIICKAHPKSIWYTPFICNAFIILSLIGVSNNSKPELISLILLSACIVLSVIGAFVGARIGQNHA